MKRQWMTVALFGLGALIGNAEPPGESPAVIKARDYGAIPDGGKASNEALRKAIAAVAALGGKPAVLQFEKGRYDFDPEQAERIPYFISNTSSADELADRRKTVGLLFKGIRNLTVEGNGALLMFDGKMTPFVIDGCENIEIRNLSEDFVRPTVSEFTIVAKGEKYLDVKVHPDSRYELRDGQFKWVGKGWRWNGRGAANQEYDPKRNTTWRGWNPINDARKIEELSPGMLRLHFDKQPGSEVGRTFQMRDLIRTDAGAFILKSRNVAFRDMKVGFIHGMALLSQFTENTTFERVICEPREGSGRTCASFCDWMHFSGCRGKIRVIDCRFSGSHDDPINVHGTHLRIMERPAPDQIVVRFMHPQSWGFEAFFPGDEIEFVNAETLLSYASNKVKTAERRNDYEILLTLEKPAPERIAKIDCVENVTWTPEVEIRGCRFAVDPTRGILVTTRRKVVIENNEFFRTTMSAIDIADDARSWFESGPVRDVSIRNNRFTGCGEPVIRIAPETAKTAPGKYVHSNIRIEGNVFQLENANSVLAAHGAEGLVFRGNTVLCRSVQPLEQYLSIRDCQEVAVSGNQVETPE